MKVVLYAAPAFVLCMAALALAASAPTAATLLLVAAVVLMGYGKVRG